MVAVVGYYSEVKLTGRQRVRKGWFGKLILQVEVEMMYIRPWLSTREHPHGYTDNGETKTKWRDAVPADVGLETVLVKGIPHVP